MPDPFWLILAVVAVACVLLYPLRRWQQARHAREMEREGGDPVPLAPPERRHRG